MTKTQRMFTLVEQWKQSGITRKEFCRQADIKVGTFAYWIAKYKRGEQQPTPGGFVRVEASAQPACRVEITYPNGVKICIDPWRKLNECLPWLNNGSRAE